MQQPLVLQVLWVCFVVAHRESTKIIGLGSWGNSCGRPNLPKFFAARANFHSSSKCSSTTTRHTTLRHRDRLLLLYQLKCSKLVFETNQRVSRGAHPSRGQNIYEERMLHLCTYIKNHTPRQPFPFTDRSNVKHGFLPFRQQAYVMFRIQDQQRRWVGMTCRKHVIISVVLLILASAAAHHAAHVAHTRVVRCLVTF